MSDVDTTMQAVLGVYRAEINSHETTVASLESQLASAGYREKQILDKVDRLDKDNDRYREKNREQVEQIEKLKGVIESLKLDLAAEREAHTKLRDDKDTK